MVKSVINSARSEEIRETLEALGIPVSLRDWRANRSGVYTAASCLAAAEVLLADRGESLDGLRVAIEGFGDVGSALARRLSQRGAVVVALSTSRGAAFCNDGIDIEEVLRIAASAGSRVVERIPGASATDRAALLAADVDVLFPCARMHGIHAGNVDAVSARYVCAGANDPVSDEARERLAERGIPYPPDFVTNAGGVLGGTLEFAGVRPAEVERIVDARIRREFTELLSRAAQRGRGLWGIAEAEARQRHAEVGRRAEAPDLAARLRGLGIAAYRRGWLPERLMAPLASRMLG